MEIGIRMTAERRRRLALHDMGNLTNPERLYDIKVAADYLDRKKAERSVPEILWRRIRREIKGFFYLMKG